MPGERPTGSSPPGARHAPEATAGVHHQGYIFDKLSVIGRGAWSAVRRAVSSFVPAKPQPGQEKPPAQAAPVADKEATPESAGQAKQGEEETLGKKVVQTAHNAVQRIDQDARAVSPELKEAVDEFKGRPHVPKAGAAHQEADAPIQRVSGDGHVSVATKLSNALHSTLDHLAQETEAVSATVKQELQEFQHPHQHIPTSTGTMP